MKDLHLAFIGCGVMGESMVAGLLRKDLVDPKNIAVSHPLAALDRRRRQRPHDLECRQLMAKNSFRKPCSARKILLSASFSGGSGDSDLSADS